MNIKFNPKTIVLSLIPIFCILKYCLTFTDDYAIFGITNVFFAGCLEIAFLTICDPNFRKNYYKKNMLFLGMYVLILYFILCLITDEYSIVNSSTYIKKLLMLFVFWGMYNYINSFSSRGKRFFSMLFLLCMIISGIYTLNVALTLGSDVIRQTTLAVYSDLVDMRYGGYDFVYMNVIVYMSMIVSFYNHRKTLTNTIRILGCIFLIFSYLVFITSGFGTSLILVLFGTIFVCLKGKTRYVVSLGLIVVVFLLSDFLIDMIQDSTIIPRLTKERITNVFFWLTGSTSTITEYSDRLERMGRSLTTFLEYPFLGGVIYVDAFMGIGRHAEWLDQLARYGLIPSAFYLFFWTNSRKNVLENVALGSEETSKFTVDNIKKIFLLLFIMGFFLNFSIDTIVAPLFLFVPFVDEIFQKNDKQEDKGGKLV